MVNYHFCRFTGRCNGIEIAKEEFLPIIPKIDLLVERVKKLEDKMKTLGAPYTPGRFEN